MKLVTKNQTNAASTKPVPTSQSIAELDLNAADVRQRLPAVAAELLTADDAAGAVTLLAKVAAAPDAVQLQTTLSKSLPQLVLLALPIMSENDLVAWLDQRLTELLDTDPTRLLDRLAIALEGMPLRGRDVVKQQLLERLKRNNSSLTQAALTSTSGQTVPPTIGNWTNEYVVRAAGAQNADQLLAARPNAAQFSQADRQRLNSWLGFVKVLSATSTSLEGVEEEIPVRQPGGQTGVFAAGRIREMPAHPAPSLPPVIQTVSPLVQPMPAQVPAPGVPAWKPAPVTPTAPVALHPEDEAEIRQQADRLTAMALTTDTHHELAGSAINRLLDSANIHLTDELLEKRLRTALTAQLKGIRSSADTLALLQRSVKIGGLGLGDAPARQVVTAAEAIVPQFHDTDGLAALQSAKDQAAAPQPVPAPVAPPVRTAPASTPGPFRPAAVPAAPVIPPPANRSTPRPFFQSKTLRPAIPLRVSPRPQADEKTQLHDIRQPPSQAKGRRVVGPVDELRDLTPEEFRRWGVSTSEAVSRLKQMFTALAKEAYHLRVQGVLGWRSSPLYQLYLEVGNESMNNRQPISVVSTTRRQRGDPTLTEEEFSAIADLNRSLRF